MVVVTSRSVDCTLICQRILIHGRTRIHTSSYKILRLILMRKSCIETEDASCFSYFLLILLIERTFGKYIFLWKRTSDQYNIINMKCLNTHDLETLRGYFLMEYIIHPYCYNGQWAWSKADFPSWCGHISQKIVARCLVPKWVDKFHWIVHLKWGRQRQLWCKNIIILPHHAFHSTKSIFGWV